jgi:YVTN family beta-propeller protein
MTQMQVALQSCILDQAVYNAKGVRQCLPNTTAGVPGIRVSGAWQQDDAGANGKVLTFGAAVYGNSIVTTQQATNIAGGSTAVATIPGVRIPATWNLDWDWPFLCGYDYTMSYADPSSMQTWYRYEHDDVDVQPAPALIKTDICFIPPSSINPSSTRFALIGSFPGSITLGGSAPFLTKFGMPLLYIYDQNANLVATETATSVSSDETQATFPFPSNLTQSGYELVPQNQINESPGLAPAGVNLLSIASSQTIAGNPFGVAALDTTTTDQSSSTQDPYGDGTCAGQSSYSSNTYTNSYPVVTQYSLNSVNNGGATIPVGPNPTAIALYGSSQDYDRYESVGQCGWRDEDITTQMSRAVVANSGGNTVSILDIVNNVTLSTITVGNQPVALAVSSDGSTAYVANYTDSTVTRVNLTTGTATATVAVGGQPTSVSLTSAGTLWVGGVGFLAEVNTETMNVVAADRADYR